MAYSLESAERFTWASVTGRLNAGRLSLLEGHLVGRRVLDAGCGGGAYVDRLARQGLDAVGVDRHAQFLRLAREGGRAGAYVQADVTALPFADRAFDCTYCFDVLEHVDDRLAIRELARVTRERLILAVPREDQTLRRFGLTFCHYMDRTHLRTYTEASLRELLSGPPFRQVSIAPELPVDLAQLVRATAELRDTRAARWGQRVLRARAALRERMRRGGPDASVGHGTSGRPLLARLLDQLSYREIYTGLTAVVDLEPSGP